MNPGTKHPATLKEIFCSFSRSRSLILQMTRREVIGRYRGSVLGLLWSFFNPLIMLTVYTVVFSVVFNVRWGMESDSKSEFALVLFIGMIVHGIFAECFGRSPGLILGHVSFVKKVVFPLEILPWVVMGSTLFHSLISLCVWLLFYLVVNHSMQWTVVFAPVVFAPLILFMMGVSWFFASLGVYLRDVGQITGVVTTMMLFISPVFYPVSRLPEQYQAIIYLNPLTFVIEQARDVLMWGRLPDWSGMLVAYAISILVAWAGFLWFQRTRRGFADVL